MKHERNIGQEILDGLDEIKQWQKGNKNLKVTHASLPSAGDVAKIRQKLHLCQEDFANFMGVSVRTLQNWEQHRREPQGAARSLLRVAQKSPEAILKALPREVIHKQDHRTKATNKRKLSAR